MVEGRLGHGKHVVISVVKLLSSSGPTMEDIITRHATQRLVFGAKQPVVATSALCTMVYVMEFNNNAWSLHCPCIDNLDIWEIVAS